MTAPSSRDEIAGNIYDAFANATIPKIASVHLLRSNVGRAGKALYT
jgi:hypothetical protein